MPSVRSAEVSSPNYLKYFRSRTAEKFRRRVLPMALACAVVSGIGSSALCAEPGGSTLTVGRFITAIQRQDFRSALEATHASRRKVAAIKEANPTVLWKQLIAEYYDREVKALSQNPSSWRSYNEALGAALGDSTSLVRTAIWLLPPGTKWSTAETRTKAISDSIQWGPYTQVTAFMLVDYATPETAPAVGNRALRHTILEFVLHGKTQGIIGVSRVQKADQYWPVPELNPTQADQMTRAFLEDKVRAFSRPTNVGEVGPDAERWMGVALPNYDSPAVLEYRRLFERAGFKLRNWTIRPGWGANRGEVSPPASWRRYERGIGNSTVQYYLEDEIEIAITKIAQREDTAAVTAHVRRKGCNEVCALLKTYWSLAVAKQMASDPGGHYNRFFMTFWYGNPDSNGSAGVTLPEEDDRMVSFEWKSRVGWAPLKQKVLASAAQSQPLGQTSGGGTPVVASDVGIATGAHDTVAAELQQLRQQVERRYEPFAILNGVLLRPRDKRLGVQSIEISGDFIVINGSRMAPEVLRPWLGDTDAELILRLAGLPVGDRQALFGFKRSVTAPARP